MACRGIQKNKKEKKGKNIRFFFSFRFSFILSIVIQKLLGKYHSLHCEKRLYIRHTNNYTARERQQAFFEKETENRGPTAIRKGKENWAVSVLTRMKREKFHK